MNDAMNNTHTDPAPAAEFDSPEVQACLNFPCSQDRTYKALIAWLSEHAELVGGYNTPDRWVIRVLQSQLRAEHAKRLATEKELADVKRDRDYIASHWAMECEKADSANAELSNQLQQYQAALAAAVDAEHWTPRLQKLAVDALVMVMQLKPLVAQLRALQPAQGREETV